MSHQQLTVGSLFSGVGGLDLGLERAGMRVIWNCEIDPYASRVLKKHWPDKPNLGDIKEINWNDIPRPDVLCGGYPCQPFSYAGARTGQHHPKHLFPYFANAICQLRPRFAILENVAGHLTLGFGDVLGTLASLGYDSRWDCLSASTFGAPHKRTRVFIVAMDSYSEGELFSSKLPTPQRINWLSEPEVGGMDDGIPHRMDRLRGLGNAVVPQVAEHIGRIVVAHAQRN